MKYRVFKKIAEAVWLWGEGDFVLIPKRKLVEHHQNPSFEISIKNNVMLAKRATKLWLDLDPAVLQALAADIPKRI